jgi:hypothetical protein
VVRCSCGTSALAGGAAGAYAADVELDATARSMVRGLTAGEHRRAGGGVSAQAWERPWTRRCQGGADVEAPTQARRAKRGGQRTLESSSRAYRLPPTALLPRRQRAMSGRLRAH